MPEEKKQTWYQKKISDLEEKVKALEELQGVNVDTPETMYGGAGNGAKLAWAPIPQNPLIERAHSTGERFVFAEKRTFKGDSGYDANIRERLISMAGEAAKEMVNQGSGEVFALKFPPFDEKNQLVLTVEVLPG